MGYCRSFLNQENKENVSLICWFCRRRRDDVIHRFTIAFELKSDQTSPIIVVSYYKLILLLFLIFKP